MTKAAERVQVLAAAFAVASGIVVGFASGTRTTVAQDKGNAPSAKSDPAYAYLGKGPTKETAGNLSAGIAGCQACHNGTDKGQAVGYVKNFKSNEFVLLNESATWVEADVHSAALTNLDGPLGKHMAELLKYDVTKAPQCLTCHSVDLSPTKALADKTHDDFATAAGGVNCTACHGLHQGWQVEHFTEPNQKGQPMPWRSKTPEYKWSRGMADLRNPVVKAALCVGCHVGNPSEGKVVTHQMYAVGHPPLPPFELASYMEGQPKHWGYPTAPELKFFEKVPEKDHWPLFHFHRADQESYLSRHFAVGAVAALRAEASLLLADAEVAAKGGDLIDYARFDCYACHHDVPNEARQKRGYDGPPGRPPLRAAVGFPAAVVAKHAEHIDAGGLKSKAAGFEAKWAALKKAATARPFGHPEQVKHAAKAVIEWCDGFLDVQSNCPTPLYTEARAAELRAAIREAAVGPAVADPEAAMSLAWGYLTLSKEAGVGLATDKLDGVIPLNVRVEPYSVTAKDPQPKPAEFAPRMQKINAFESGRFSKAFAELAPFGPKK